MLSVVNESAAKKNDKRSTSTECKRLKETDEYAEADSYVYV